MYTTKFAEAKNIQEDAQGILRSSTRIPLQQLFDILERLLHPQANDIHRSDTMELEDILENVKFF